jgi:hypothetical protein
MLISDVRQAVGGNGGAILVKRHEMSSVECAFDD